MRIKNQYYLEQSSLLNGMLFLERLAYHGLKTFVYYYLISKAINLYNTDAKELLLTFSLALLFARIFGGLIVDFLLSEKVSILVSCSLQILGIILFMQEQLSIFYLGMFVFILGQALFSPTILKQIGSLYYERKNKLDGALTFNYLALNLGSFLAPFAFGLLDMTETYTSGFVSCIICFFLIIGLSFFLKSTTNKPKENQESFNPPNRVYGIIFGSILGLFLYFLFQRILNNSMSNFNESKYQLINSSMIITLLPALIPLAAYLIFGIIWNRVQFPALLKVTIGFGIASISIIAAILTMSNIETNNPVFIASFIILSGLGEVLVAPIFLSLILQYYPQKYMGTFSGLALSSFGFLSVFIGNKLFTGIGEWNYQLLTLISGAGFFICTIILLILFLLTKTKDATSNHLDEF
jgi:proton-dependent oligopeptide transporter, POT family